MDKKPDYFKLTIAAYLCQQFKEFQTLKSRIMARLNRENSTIIDRLLEKLLPKICGYFHDYALDVINEKTLTKRVKREIRIMLFSEKLAAQQNDTHNPDEKLIQNQVETIFAYAARIFLNFEKRDDLLKFVQAAEEMAASRNWDYKPPAMIFNNHYYNLLLIKLFPQKDTLEWRYRTMLAHMSPGEIAKRFIAYDYSDLAYYKLNNEQQEKIFELALSELGGTIELTKRLQELDAAVTAVIEQRLKEIYSTR